MKSDNCYQLCNCYCSNWILLTLFILMTSLFPINSAFLVTAIRHSSPNNIKPKGPKGPMMLSTENSNDEASMELITKEFHQLASAAVDLSNAHVSEAGILSSTYCCNIIMNDDDDSSAVVVLPCPIVCICSYIRNHPAQQKYIY